MFRRKSELLSTAESSAKLVSKTSKKAKERRTTGTQMSLGKKSRTPERTRTPQSRVAAPEDRFYLDYRIVG